MKEEFCPFDESKECQSCYYWKPGIGCDYEKMNQDVLKVSEGLSVVELDKKWHIKH